jgi:hypothetical protein
MVSIFNLFLKIIFSGGRIGDPYVIYYRRKKCFLKSIKNTSHYFKNLIKISKNIKNQAL